MKLYVYIILFVLLAIYVSRHSCYLEKFTTNNYDSPNLYDPLETEKVQPILIDSNPNAVPGWDAHGSNLYQDKLWLIKNQGFSDIYNYEDNGGEIIFNVANGFDVIVQPKQMDKSVAPIEEIQVKSNEIPKEFNYKGSVYSLLGMGSNPYFNQYYLVYEHEVKSKLTNTLIEEELEYIKNNRIFEYTLVKIKNDKPVIVHEIGPRIKINLGDVVYFSLATFQLGPLSISKI